MLQLPSQPAGSENREPWTQTKWWTVPRVPSDSSSGERYAAAREEFLRGFARLERLSSELVQDLVKAAEAGQPLTVHVETPGLNLEIISAILLCAFEFETSVVLVPWRPGDG